MIGWREVTDIAFEGLADLKENWDTYGAKPIDPKMIEAARFVLSQIMADDTPTPTVVPMSNSSVQFEWSSAKCDIEVELTESDDGLSPYCEVLYVEHDVKDGTSEHRLWLDDLTELRQKLAEIYTRQDD